jgi:hypothetical protein
MRRTRPCLAVFLAAILSPSTQIEARRSIAPQASRAPAAAPQMKTAYMPSAAAAKPEAPKSLIAAVMLGDIGYSNGLRFSNLGGRREVFIPLPEGIALSRAELVLALDDVSAHEALRSLEVLVNDRSVAAIPLDGKSIGRIVRIPLFDAVAQNGFLKLAFNYSGAATQDRCIDVRYVGDSLTVRPDTAVEFEIDTTGIPNIAATAALMPRNVAIILSNPRLPADDIAAALTLARSLAATGRRVSFHHGLDSLADLVKQDDPHRWTRGVIIVGPLDQVATHVDATLPALASATTQDTISATRIADVPVLLVTDAASAHAGSLMGNPSLAALRDTPAASVGKVALPEGRVDRVSFDALGLVPAQADVFGRADLMVTIPTHALPAETKPTRLMLDVMVAPDGSGEKAVVSAFVNERLLGSQVAAIGEPTRLDFPLPDGLVGTAANIRVVVQRLSAQGDCRFEPQGYPAQILGSSALILSPADPLPTDFSDLVPLWSKGVEVLIPASAAASPESVVGLLADILDVLSKETAPITVKFIDAGTAAAPDAPFLAVSDVPPAGAVQHVRFDRGRVVVTDREGRTRLDLGGLATGAVAQIVTANAQPGLWIKSLAADGSLPVAASVSLDRGDVAFLDETGVALAMSTERDTLLNIAYPDQVSWLTIAERFRSSIFAGLWAVVTLAFLFAVQRIYRRHRAGRTRD